MAVGTHWEWRAFGALSLELVLDTAAALSKHFGETDRGWRLSDEYLWTPACDANVKLRGDQLKFKRLLEARADGCELWTEAQGDTFSFPLPDAALGLLRAHVKAEPPPGFEAARTSPARFRECLGAFEPAIRLVEVRKHRVQFDLAIDDCAVLVELAQIVAPCETWSLGLEGEDLAGPSGIDPVRSQASRRAVAQARERLGLPGRMRRRSYLQALADWL